MAIMNGGTTLQHHTPRHATEKLADKMWTKRIERETLKEHQDKFDILSTRFNDDNSMNINIFAESKPDESFEHKQADLEDVYFVALKNGK
jgi:hypothetical protein